MGTITIMGCFWMSERVALELLRKANVRHPLLRVWINRYLENPTYVGNLPDPEDVLLEEWQRGAYSDCTESETANFVAAARRDGYWAKVERHKAYGKSHVSATLTYPDDENDESLNLVLFRQQLDEVALHLLYAVQEHRKARGDLPTAIVDFHENTLRAHEIYYAEREW